MNGWLWSSRNRHDCFHCRSRLSHLGHNFPHVILDTLQKWLELGRPPVDTLEIRLPLPSHGGAFDFDVNDFDKTGTLFRRLETLAVARDITTLQQDFDNSCARGRRSKASLLHRL